MNSASEKTSNDTTSIAQLRVMLEEMISTDRSGEAIDMVLEMLTFLRQENTALGLRLRKQLKARFGASSEKISANQLSLFLSILGVDDDETEGESETTEPEGTGDPELDAHFENKKKTKKAKRRRGRRPLPESLPREEISIPVTRAARICSVCGTDKACIGHDKSEVLEWVPGTFKVLVYAREKLACKPCQGEVVIAPVANKIIPGGLPGAGLLTELVLKKFKYSLPLWRQAHYFSTLGVDLAESTLCGWIKAVANLFSPVYRETIRLALLSHCINTDDTHIKVLDPAHPKGIKRGSMWIYVGDKRYVFFDYTPDRSSEGPMRILKGYRGKVQADAYSAYNFLFEGEDASAIELGCMMHARRYFVEALDGGDLAAALPVKWFQHLFKIEEYAKDIGADADARYAIRQKKSKPVMSKLGKWLAGHYETTLGDTPLGAAIGYNVRQWDALNRFLDDGEVEIDNGLAERLIRTLAIGRKNYMFAGSDEGAQSAAILYSIIGSCDMANVDAGAYLQDVMTKIAAGWPQSKISELIPAHWATKHNAAATQAAA